MSGTRVLVLAAAAIAAVFVALYVRNASGSSAPVIVQAPQGEPVNAAGNTEAVLVARNAVTIGQRIGPDDLYWQAWPAAAISPVYFTEARFPKGLEEFVGAVARDNIALGEPITGRKLVLTGDQGFMAAILSPGMRAVSVRVTAETGAAGFILPGDRVDVIITHDVPGPAGEQTVSQTFLENVRVLAIDQLPQTVREGAAMVGSTATLELIQEDAELLTLAESRGRLTLVLRSVTDRHPNADAMFSAAASRATEARRALRGEVGAEDRRTIIKSGVASPVFFGGGK